MRESDDTGGVYMYSVYRFNQDDTAVAKGPFVPGIK